MPLPEWFTPLWEARKWVTSFITSLNGTVINCNRNATKLCWAITANGIHFTCEKWCKIDENLRRWKLFIASSLKPTISFHFNWIRFYGCGSEVKGSSHVDGVKESPCKEYNFNLGQFRIKAHFSVAVLPWITFLTFSYLFQMIPTVASFVYLSFAKIRL